MFQQPKQFRHGGRTFNDRIQLAEGETEQVRFKAWLTEIQNLPPVCEHHAKTRLIRDDDECKLWPATVADKHWPYESRPIPGAFVFRAAFRCPSCRTAYALCPPEFHQTPLAVFDTSTPERAAALSRCREFVSQVNAKGCGWLALVGKPGTGKTRLTSGIVRELENRTALYIRQGELTLALRATYGRKEVILRRRATEDDADDTQPGPLEVAQAAPFLILDELGCTALANDERLLLDELFKVRYDQRKPTVLISNLPLDQLKEFVGDALADRIRHATGNGKFLLQFSGESFRQSSGEDYLAGLQ